MNARFTAILVTIALSASPALSQTTTAPSTAPAPGPTWGAPADASVPSQEVGLQVPERDSLVVMGRTGCPIVIAGHEVWDIAKQQRTGITIPHTGLFRSFAALSDDGSLLAVAPERNGRSSDDGDDVTLWSTRTGAKVSTISAAERDRDLEYLAFAGDQYLLISSRATSARKPPMEVWDTHTGKLVRRFPCNFNGPGNTTISPDGRYVAILDWEHVYIYDIGTGSRVASMPAPTSAPLGLSDVPGTPASRSRESSVPFVSYSTLAFSPDGSQLAAGADFDNRPFLCWNNKGQLLYNFLFPLSEIDHRSERPFIQWSPDSSTWLVAQHWIVDPKTRRPLWMFPLAFADAPLSVFLDNDHFFLLHRVIKDDAEVVRIPWEDIHKALAAMKDPANSLFAPGQRVSLEVKCLHCRGDQIDTAKLLTDAVTARLALLGVQIADQQPTVVSVTLEESASDPRPIVTRGIPFDRAGTPTNRKASVAKGLLTFTIHARGTEDAGAFHITEASESPAFVNDTITDELLRSEMLQFLMSKFEREPLPYFLSKSTPPVELPLGFTIPEHVRPNFLKEFSNEPLTEMDNPFHPRRTPQEPPPVDPKTPTQRM